MSLLFLRRAKPLFVSCCSATHSRSSFLSPTLTNQLLRSFHGSRTMVRFCNHRLFVSPLGLPTGFRNSVAICLSLRIECLFSEFRSRNQRRRSLQRRSLSGKRRRKRRFDLWFFSPFFSETFSGVDSTWLCCSLWAWF